MARAALQRRAASIRWPISFGPKYPDAAITVYDWDQWYRVYMDTRAHSQDVTATNIIIGYSLGANAVDWVSVQKPNVQIDLAIFIDATVWSNLFPIQSNVQRALVFKNNNPVDIVGLSSIPTAPDFDVSRMTVLHTTLSEAQPSGGQPDGPRRCFFVAITGADHGRRFLH